MVSQVNTWYLRRTHCISGHATFYVQRTQYETYVCVKRPNVLGERKNVLGKRKNVLGRRKNVLGIVNTDATPRKCVCVRV
jgi:hypothetical protein